MRTAYVLPILMMLIIGISAALDFTQHRDEPGTARVTISSLTIAQCNTSASIVSQPVFILRDKQCERYYIPAQSSCFASLDCAEVEQCLSAPNTNKECRGCPLITRSMTLKLKEERVVLYNDQDCNDEVIQVPPKTNICTPDLIGNNTCGITKAAVFYTLSPDIPSKKCGKKGAIILMIAIILYLPCVVIAITCYVLGAATLVIGIGAFCMYCGFLIITPLLLLIYFLNENGVCI